MRQAAYEADVPIPGLPLVEIVDVGRVLIENHLGVTQYGDHSICVKVKYGSIEVSGSNLILSRMTKGQLVISGVVDCVRLLRRYD
jgi:sporulation protein YqfC